MTAIQNTPTRSCTEADLHGLLRQRYTVLSGNGPRYAYLPHVRSSAGFDAERTLDAVVMDLWPSKGLVLHGFEMKCSRSDWLRELKQPEKAATFVDRVDRFWIVAASDDIVQRDELSPSWGLLHVVDTPTGPALRSARAAHRLPSTEERRAVRRSWLACLLRSAAGPGDLR